MVLGEHINSLFSNDEQKPVSMTFPQGIEFNALQHGKVMDNQARADRLIDPNGFSTEHTLYGQQALDGKTINMETNLKVIEGFDTKSNIQKASTAINKKNIDDKIKRETISEDATKIAKSYNDSMDGLLKTTTDFKAS